MIQEANANYHIVTIESNNNNESASSFKFLLSPVDTQDDMLEPTSERKREG